MFTFYYVDKLPQQNGQHSLHVKGCRHLPPPQQRQFIGSFYSVSDALRVARLRVGAVVHCRACLLSSRMSPPRRQQAGKTQVSRTQTTGGKHCDR